MNVATGQLKHWLSVSSCGGGGETYTVLGVTVSQLQRIKTGPQLQIFLQLPCVFCYRNKKHMETKKMFLFNILASLTLKCPKLDLDLTL